MKETGYELGRKLAETVTEEGTGIEFMEETEEETE